MRSLQTKMIVFISAIVLVAMAAAGANGAFRLTNLMMDHMGQQAETAALHASTYIDPDLFQTITPESGETEPYWTMRSKLNEIREATGLKYLYTMRMIEHPDGGKEYIYVVDGMPEDSDDASPIGEVETELSEALERVFETGQVQFDPLDYFEGYGYIVSAYVPIVDESGTVVGVIGADFDGTQIQNSLDRIKVQSVLMFGLILLVAVALTYAVSRYIARPIKSLTNQVVRIGEGDLTVDIPAAISKRKDEIGALASATQATAAELRRLIHELQQSVTRLAQSSNLLKSASAESEKMAGGISLTIQDASEAASTQLFRMEETARAMNEVATGVNRIAEAAADVAELSGMAGANAEQGSEKVQRVISQMDTIVAANEMMNRIMDQLSRRAGDIRQMVGEIGTIASQTNILALNAGIEASHAGEHGRGFAVVAGEIRRLAAQTSEFSDKITEMIEMMQEDTRQASAAIESGMDEARTGQEAAEQAGEAFDTIKAEIHKLVEQMEDVSATAQQMASGSQEVTATVHDVSDITRQLSEQFAEVAASTENQLRHVGQVADEAEQLEQMAHNLSGSVARFKVN